MVCGSFLVRTVTTHGYGDLTRGLHKRERRCLNPRHWTLSMPGPPPRQGALAWTRGPRRFEGASLAAPDHSRHRTGQFWPGDVGQTATERNGLVHSTNWLEQRASAIRGI